MRIWRQTEPGAWLLIASSLLGSIPSGFLIVTLPIYLDRVGLHPGLIGALFTISGIASSILLVIFGFLADRFGRKPFVVIGTLFPVVSYAILSITVAQPMLMIASAIGGIGLAGGMSGALVTSGFNALLSEKSDAKARTAVFSLAEMAWVFAGLVGSLLAGLPLILQHAFGLSYRGAYHFCFLALVGLGLLATLILLPLHEPRSRLTMRPHWLPRESGRRILLLSISLGTLGLGLGFIVQLLPLWFHLRFHVSEAFLGPWYGVSQVLALGSLALATPLSRRLGAVPYVIIMQGVASAMLVLVGFAPFASVAALLWIGRQMWMNASWPVQQAYIMDVVDRRERATASSLTYAAWSIASALTPPIGGALLGAHLYTVPFLLGAVCYGVSIIVFARFFLHVRPARPDAAGQELGNAAGG